MSKEIPLTKGYMAIVDDEDYEYLMQWKWFVSQSSKGKFYARAHVPGTNQKIYIHRLIMNPSKGLVVDHIDGNTMNNKRSNLRIVTQADNTKNTSRPKGNTSGYAGVSYRKDIGKWRARVSSKDSKGRKIEIQVTCASKEEAIAERNRLAIEYYGEYRHDK